MKNNQAQQDCILRMENLREYAENDHESLKLQLADMMAQLQMIEQCLWDEAGDDCTTYCKELASGESGTWTLALGNFEVQYFNPEDNAKEVTIARALRIIRLPSNMLSQFLTDTPSSIKIPLFLFRYQFYQQDHA
ncbi:uncharacterized protein LAJ45_00044 [Morchella importuna]|uniref:uncharacterized protein n=1 Tax=Morchella importuna TaxID=1174673 RepID=UPI001E8E28E2|nr:uncharacterized protein LAJ45_00044 [Morchella importuna]KAH8155036.1 hypothetical protein LAJ45_00044 [Morchella importuna]